MKKLNFGTGIAIALVTFIAFILTLAISLISTKVDLQQENYYSEDLIYQDKIDALKNGNYHQLIQRIDIDKQNIILALSDEQIENGKLRFFRPNDDKLDQSFSFEETKTLIIPLNLFQKGKYDVEFEYLLEGKVCLEKNTVEIK